LLDDNMFKLWKDGVVEKSDVLLRAVNPEELGAKIARVERGIFESEEDDTGRPDAA